MKNMEERSLHKLEFNKIIDQLTDQAASEPGKALCRELAPSTNPFEIRRWQRETAEAFTYLVTRGTPSFTGLRDVENSVNRTEKGAVLSMEELLNIASFLYGVDIMKTYGKHLREDESYPCLDPMFQGLNPLVSVEKEIHRCIASEEEMYDHASPKLASIRRDIRLTQERVRSHLQSMIHSNTYKTMLQDEVITQRNGRYCIPVKAEFKGSVAGMIHDQSGSGSTIFIEPQAVVQLNNQAAELSLEEQREIRRILASLSELVHSGASELLDDYHLMVQLDFYFAKAKLALKMNAVEPIFTDTMEIEIKNARHPLLDPGKVVPITIYIGGSFTSLIVTGPNTGGKTVTLKTLGLLQAMGQAGLHIPSSDKPKLAVLDQIFADIGDEQSIEQSLSTFSSHMVNIVDILKKVTPFSLVLFDEPGRGTDPAEGAALAISILNDLKAKGSRVMATTHYTELKTYAIGTEGVENASCEFDIKSLAPTYKLMIGIPGSSNAFAIAKRLGMPDEITNAAREGMDENQLNMERIISQLEENEKEMSRLREELEIETNSASQIRARLADKEKKLDEKKAEIIDKARIEAREIVEDAKDTADAAIRDYNKWLKNPKDADARIMEQMRSDLRKKKDSYNIKEEKKQKKYSGHKLTDFHIGDKVLVLSLDTEGHIIGLADSKGLLEVEMGILTSRHPADDLLIIDEDKIKTKNAAEQFKMASVGPGVAYTFRPEINLLGKTVDDALMSLDKYLDDALLAHAEQVTIIHGKGTGALRRGITEYLKKKKFVKEFRSGEFGEGDAGVTIVKL